MSRLVLAYAVSIHRSQGLQWDAVTVCLPRAAYSIGSVELLYTALSRARVELALVAENQAVAMVMRRRVGAERKTALSLFLARAGLHLERRAG